MIIIPLNYYADIFKLFYEQTPLFYSNYFVATPINFHKIFTNFYITVVNCLSELLNAVLLVTTCSVEKLYDVSSSMCFWEVTLLLWLDVHTLWSWSSLNPSSSSSAPWPSPCNELLLLELLLFFSMSLLWSLLSNVSESDVSGSISGSWLLFTRMVAINKMPLLLSLISSI